MVIGASILATVGQLPAIHTSLALSLAGAAAPRLPLHGVNGGQTPSTYATESWSGWVGEKGGEKLGKS